jgi:transcriptional regulator with XRE-family HTH domain
MEGIAERIRELRENLGINQDDFAKKIDLDRSHISKFEKGAITPKDRHIALICGAFNVNEVWLRNGIGEMYNPPPDEPPLTDNEEKLLKLFKQLLPDLQKYVIEQVNKLLKMTQESWVPPSENGEKKTAGE